MLDIFGVLSEALEAEATDVYLKSQMCPVIRKNGSLEPLNSTELTNDDILECLLKISDEGQRQKIEEQGECCFILENIYCGRYRVSAFRSSGQISLMFHRILPVAEMCRLPGIDQNAVEELAGLIKGLVLFAGEAGSGRTTAATVVLEEINRLRPVHIVMLESPVEAGFLAKRALISQREYETDFADAGEAFEGAMKEHAEVLFVGDRIFAKPEGAKSLLQKCFSAVNAGMLVFTEVYGSELSEIMEQLLLFFPKKEKDEMRKLIARMLKAVVICKPADGPEGLRTEWMVVKVDESVKNRICNSL